MVASLPAEVLTHMALTISFNTGFMKLVRAIAAGETETALRLISESVELAQARSEVGATRQMAKLYFFEEIGHYLNIGDTALHVAAAGYKWEIAQVLIARGADCAVKNRLGAEPLHYAADANIWNPTAQASTITGLIGAGANPNSLDKNGASPLHRAVRTRGAAAVEALLVGGALPRRANKRGSTPLHLAVQTTGRGGSGAPQAVEQQRQIILLLLQWGANLDDQDGRGKTVADCIKTNRTEWIRELIRAFSHPTG